MACSCPLRISGSGWKGNASVRAPNWRAVVARLKPLTKSSLNPSTLQIALCRPHLGSRTSPCCNLCNMSAPRKQHSLPQGTTVWSCRTVKPYSSMLASQPSASHCRRLDTNLETNSPSRSVFLRASSIVTSVIFFYLSWGRVAEPRRSHTRKTMSECRSLVVIHISSPFRRSESRTPSIPQVSHLKTPGVCLAIGYNTSSETKTYKVAPSGGAGRRHSPFHIRQAALPWSWPRCLS